MLIKVLSAVFKIIAGAMAVVIVGVIMGEVIHAIVAEKTMQVKLLWVNIPLIGLMLYTALLSAYGTYKLAVLLVRRFTSAA